MLFSGISRPAALACPLSLSLLMSVSALGCWADLDSEPSEESSAPGAVGGADLRGRRLPRSLQSHYVIPIGHMAHENAANACQSN